MGRANADLRAITANISVADTEAGYACFGTNTAPGQVVKIRLSDLTRIGVIGLAPQEEYLTAAGSTRQQGVPTSPRVPRPPSG